MDNKVRLGLTFGIFLAFWHLVWAICIAIGIAKPFMDWILAMHMMTWSWNVLPFNIVYTIVLLVVTFVCGFVIGWLGTWVYGWFGKK
jgi:hypothetical protein